MLFALIAGGCATLLAWLVTWALSGGVTTLKRLALDSTSDPRKTHANAVPRLGGIPLFLAMVLSVIAAGMLHGWNQSLLIIASAATLMFALGLVDDFRPIGAKAKLLGQIFIALGVYAAGLQMDAITYPLHENPFSLELHGWSLLFTLFWLIAIPNLVNLIDGADGLAAGLGLLLFSVLGYVGWTGGQPAVAVISMAMAGACIGFLCFNFPPAKIFLGDGGAYLIGFLVALLSLQSEQKGSVAGVLFVVVIALGLPIADTLLALARRAVRGFPLFHADAEHIHHRLQNLGISGKRLAVGMYLVFVIFAMLGLSVLLSQGRTFPIVLAVVFIAGIFAVRELGYIWQWNKLTMQLARAFERRSDVRYALALAQVLEIELERKEPEAFANRFREELARLDMTVQHGPSESSYALFENAEGTLFLHFAGQVGPRDEFHWRRLAECFQRVARKARDRWGHEWVILLGRKADS